MSNELAKQQPKTLKEYIEAKRPEIAAMLPSHVNIDRFLKSALLAVARNKRLQECTSMSLLTAVVNAAELGLDFTPARRAAHLVPFKNNKTNTMEAQFMPGFIGLMDLVRNTGKVKDIQAHVVHEKDEFDIEYGSNMRLFHKPTLDDDSGKMVGAYCIATLQDGTKAFEFMKKSEIDAIRKRSKAANDGPWVTDYNEMARKTVVRRLCKYLPSSPDLDKAIEADNRAIGLPEIEIEPMEDGEKTSRLAERLSSQDESDATYQDVQDAPKYYDPPPAEEDHPETEPAPPEQKAAAEGPVKVIIGMLKDKETTIPKLKAAATKAGVLFTVPQSLRPAEAQKILDNLE